MKKGLTERYGRYHARFVLDDVYLALPERIRNHAYLYLLALSGHRRADEADENMPVNVATALAQGMGLKAEVMLSALEAIKDPKTGEPRVVERVGDVVRLLKHSKWQDMPEEIAELKRARSEAGARGAAVRWHKPHIEDARAQEEMTTPIASAIAPAIASAKAGAMANAWQVDGKPIAERERERERERVYLLHPLPPQDVGRVR